MIKFHSYFLERTNAEKYAIQNLYYAIAEDEALTNYTLKRGAFSAHLLKESKKINEEWDKFAQEQQTLAQGYRNRILVAIENAAKEYAKAIWDREGYEVKLVPKNEGGNKND